MKSVPHIALPATDPATPKLDARTYADFRVRGLAVAFTVFTVWALLVAGGLSGQISGLLALPWIAATAFAYTGLFITAHDAMHGLVAPQHPRLNDAIGRAACWLFAAIPWRTLRSAHHEHHAHPASDDDPDFHTPHNPVLWYVRFLARYATITQFVVMGAVYNLLHHGLGVAYSTLWAFWIAPQVLSTVQLFAAGTWWPHRPGAYASEDGHRARSLDVRPLWSFLACYHFGYHYEHHAYPFVPWWRLPAARRARLASAAVALFALTFASHVDASEPDTVARLGEVVPRAELDLSGTWVHRQDTTTVSRIATVGRVRSTTTSFVLYELRQTEGELRGHGRVCDIRIDSGSPMVETYLPDAFLEAVEAPQLRASVERDAGTVRVEQARTWSVLGASLDAPSDDALPSDADDPRVRDDDHDGHPGVTVRIGGLIDGEVYLVQRGWSEFAGTAHDADTIRGDVSFDQDQEILGATRRALRSQPPTRPDDRPGASTFVMLRLSEGAGCREAVEAGLIDARR